MDDDQMKKTWVAHVTGLIDWPQSIIVKVESETDARAIVLDWLTKKQLRRMDGKLGDGVYRDFRSGDIQVRKALDLEEQLEIDAWLDGEDIDVWKRYVQENRE